MQHCGDAPVALVDGPQQRLFLVFPGFVGRLQLRLQFRVAPLGFLSLLCDHLVQTLNFVAAPVDLPLTLGDSLIQRLDFDVAPLGFLGLLCDHLVQTLHFVAAPSDLILSLGDSGVQSFNKPAFFLAAALLAIEIRRQVRDFRLQRRLVVYGAPSEQQRSAKQRAQIVEARTDFVQRVKIGRPFFIKGPPLQDFPGIANPADALNGCLHCVPLVGVMAQIRG